MRIQVVDQAIQVCNRHLTQTNAKGTEIEAYLTRYLLVFICARFEETIENIVIERARKSKDKFIVSFVESSIHNIFRSTKTSEIAGLLNRFGPEYKHSFQKNVQGKPEETYFNNIVINRHSIAHSLGSNLTFDELVFHYEKAHIILDYVQDALKGQ